MTNRRQTLTELGMLGIVLFVGLAFAGGAYFFGGAVDFGLGAANLTDQLPIVGVFLLWVAGGSVVAVLAGCACWWVERGRAARAEQASVTREPAPELPAAPAGLPAPARTRRAGAAMAKR